MPSDLWKPALFLAIPFICALGLSYLLWLDLQEDATVGSGVKAVAKIGDTQGDAQRRPGDRFRWFRIGRNRGVYTADSVSTGPHSRIVLVFSDGSEVEVAENSLMTIEDRGDKGVSVNVRSGNLSFKAATKKPHPASPNSPNVPGAVVAKSAPPILLETQGKAINIGDAQGSISVKEGLVSIDVKKGALVVGEGANAQKVDSGKRIQMGEDGSTQLSDVTFKLVTPTFDQLFLAAKRGQNANPVRFAWEQPKKVRKVDLEISSHLDFSKIWQSVSVDGASKTELALPPGKYYWRLRASQASVSETGRFEVFEGDVIHLSEPQDNASFMSSLNNSPPTEALFAWAGHESLKNFVVQISQDPEFKNKVQSEDIGKQTRAFLKLKDPGQLYWRVQARDDQGKPLATSETRHFFLIRAEKPAQNIAGKTSASPLPAPIVPVPFQAILPQSGAKFSLAARDTRREAPKQPIRFQWTCPTADRETTLVVRKKDGTKSSKETFRKKLESSGTWLADAPGTYEWEIQSLHCHSVSTFEVETVLQSIEEPRILVAGRAQKNNRLSDGGLLREDPNLKVSWKPVSGVSNYKLIFSRSETFDQVNIEKEVSGTSQVLESKQFPFSPVYYRVEAVTKSGQVVTSPISKFDFQFLPPILAAPLDASRFSKAQLKKKGADLVVLSWEHTNFTTEYRLEVATDRGFKRILIQGASKDNFYILKKLAVGTYYWRVRSVRSTMLSSPSRAISFAIRP